MDNDRKDPETYNLMIIPVDFENSPNQKDLCENDPAPDEVFQELNVNDLSFSSSCRSVRSVDVDKLELQKKIKSVKGKICSLKGQLRELEARFNRLSNDNMNRPTNRLKNCRSRRRSYSVRLDFQKPVQQLQRTDECQTNVHESKRSQANLEAVSKPCVSVLFTDIVGFTSISSGMQPGKVSDLLDRLFSKFDLLATKHGVRNIDIIGDAYMAATNLLDDQPTDHAARLARFALDAVDAARATPVDPDAPNSPCVEIRVGIHSGPVSACVLGTHGAKHTLVGDTVNVASRMESASIPGHAQCSEAAAALIAEQAPDIVLQPRTGGILVKGKGHMRTFWVGSAGTALRHLPRVHFRPARGAGGAGGPARRDGVEVWTRLCSAGGSGVDAGAREPGRPGGSAPLPAGGPPVEALRRAESSGALYITRLRSAQAAL